MANIRKRLERLEQRFGQTGHENLFDRLILVRSGDPEPEVGESERVCIVRFVPPGEGAPS